MKPIVILILISASTAAAWEQVYGKTAGFGDDEFTDSDGIKYLKDNRTSFRYDKLMHIGNVPEVDRNLYQYYVHTDKNESPITHEISLENDGLYVLIVKLSHTGNKNEHFMSMTLNKDIRLLNFADSYEECGGKYKGAVKYFYFCIADKTLYYKKESSTIRDGKITVEVQSIRGWIDLSSIVVLSGSLGELYKLKSAATKVPLYFDPLHFMCATKSSINRQTLLEQKIIERNREVDLKLQKLDEESTKINQNLEKVQAELATLLTSIDEVIRTTKNAATDSQNEQGDKHNFKQVQDGIEHMAKQSELDPNILEPRT